MAHILLGVSGGIAVYKAVDVVSRLVKLGHEVDVIMTKHAKEFVTPLTFQSISGRKVHEDMFDNISEWDIEHISLAKRADIVAIVPATANVIGKIAGGIADDLLTTTIMATKAPVVIAPAMNTVMYENPIVQDNMKKLEKFGYHILDTDEGRLACGDIGYGKLLPVEDIVKQLQDRIDGL